MAICLAAGKGLKKNYKCPAVTKFSRISAKCLFLVLSNRLKVFHLHLELPSDQENKNGFAAVSYTHLTLPTKRIV